jgi:hypothetical protein
MVTVVGSIPTWTTATDLSSLAMTMSDVLANKNAKLCTGGHGMHGDCQFSRQGLAIRSRVTSLAFVPSPPSLFID